jgi:hypothetical protein
MRTIPATQALDRYKNIIRVVGSKNLPSTANKEYTQDNALLQWHILVAQYSQSTYQIFFDSNSLSLQRCGIGSAQSTISVKTLTAELAYR